MSTFLKSETDQILVHAEACQHLHRTVSNVKEQGNQVGVAINPGTPVAAVEEVLSILDIVMVMSVNPGICRPVVHIRKREQDSKAAEGD